VFNTGDDAMSWFEGIIKGLTCPSCLTPNSFGIQQGTYTTRGKKSGRAKYECSVCDYTQVIG